LAACKAFARTGARLVISDIDEEAGTRVVKRLTGCGRQAIFVRADVSKVADVEHLVEAAVNSYGCLDIAFNNAGIEGELARTADYTDEAWDRVIAVNLTGVRLCMKYEIKEMLKHGGGAIVNNASILGVVGLANASAYTAAKHALGGLTKSMALSLLPHHILVNAVAPGAIATAMNDMKDDQQGRRMPEIPIGRPGDTREVASLVAWLCSEWATYTTGQSFIVDGGFMLANPQFKGYHQ